jgi:branched-chain amino acid transport system substrate-binding protein
MAAVVAVVLTACGSSSNNSGSGSGGSASATSANSSTSAGATSTSAGGSSGTSTSSSANKSPIKIGAVIDETGIMKPTDEPALFGAQLEMKKVNAAGGVDGRKLEMTVQNDQLQPSLTKSDALKAVSDSDILWVTCDVDFATPSIQVGLQAKKLTVSPCIGTDQMGPKRFGSQGALAFSYGNVAQDEGTADAQIAKKQGWKTAVVVTDKQIVYNQNVCSTFAQKFAAMGGKVIDQQSWTQGDHTIGDVAGKVAQDKADVIMVCTTAAPDISTLLSDVRSAGDNTPFLAPWSLDGTYWMPKSPKISTGFWTDSYSSVYGDDPSPAIRKLIKQLSAEGHAPVTGGFVAGSAAIDGIVAALKADGGSTDGAKLAAAMQKFHDLPTVSGNVSFSPSLHTVSGRAYRVLEVTSDKGHYKYTIDAQGKVS